MYDVPESKSNHLWRKTVWLTDADEHPLGPHHSAEVYCSEENNGYAVWYIRKLGRACAGCQPGVENGDYLMSYHAKTARDQALERAVLLANSGTTQDEVVAALDKLTARAHKV